MPEIMDILDAVSVIKDGDTIGVNAFLAIINPAQLLHAVGERYKKTGQGGGLTFFSPSGFGDWNRGSICESPALSGAMTKIISGHYSSMPQTAQMVLENQIEGYNIPMGAMSHMIRAAASGKDFYITEIGLNLFADPKYNGYRLNEKAKDVLVEEIFIDNKRYLKYQTPKLDIALIKGTSADKFGNISFEKEGLAGDALALTQAVKRRGGKVIVQVERMTEEHKRPWDVIIPAPLVDIITITPEQTQITGIDAYHPEYAGDVFMDEQDMADYILEREKDAAPDLARSIIAKKAIGFLSPKDIVNIGVGIPESVAVEAAKHELLKSVVLTVESGSFHGVPASGKAFGACIGAHSICTLSEQFDFYDGGGLDITFIGALEIDASGNVNSHYSKSKLSGIGGFANITQCTKKVVFCATFSSGGLVIEEAADGGIRIVQEGKYLKFVEALQSVSFSTKNAFANGQQVHYVTERCTFALKESGLEIIEVTKGVDLQRDIIDKLPFAVTVAPGL